MTRHVPLRYPTRIPVLVRHAAPAIDPDVPPDRWHLTGDGRRAARRLAARLPHTALIHSSDEVKAVETAREIAAVTGATVVEDPRLREVGRPHRPCDETLAPRYLAGELHPGWEPHSAVVERFAEALEDAEIAVAHGQAITLYLASIGRVSDPTGSGAN